jgi:hypothetical protein
VFCWSLSGLLSKTLFERANIEHRKSNIENRTSNVEQVTWNRANKFSTRNIPTLQATAPVDVNAGNCLQLFLAAPSCNFLALSECMSQHHKTWVFARSDKVPSPKSLELTETHVAERKMRQTQTESWLGSACPRCTEHQRNGGSLCPSSTQGHPRGTDFEARVS